MSLKSRLLWSLRNMSILTLDRKDNYTNAIVLIDTKEETNTKNVEEFSPNSTVHCAPI